MSAPRGNRAWVPALTAPLVLLATFVAMGALNRSALGDDTGPSSPDASLWRWLLAADNAFWGSTPFDASDGGGILLATCVSAAVLALVALLLIWLAVRSLAPGSGSFAVFLSTWMALVVASTAGAITFWVMLNRDQLGASGAGRTEFAVLTNGLQYGAKYGWFAALVGVLVWTLVRPGADDVSRPVSGELPAPTPYPEAERVEGPDEEYDDPRLAELMDEPRTDPTPSSLLDQHRREQPEPEPVPEPEQPTYVGRRSSGRYQEGVTDQPVAAPVDEPPASGGSHRGKRSR